MSGVVVNLIKEGFFLDSVALMRFSRTIAGLEGVEEAALMMGTPSHRKIMEDAGILGSEGKLAQGSDLMIGVRAANQEAAEMALEESANLLERSSAAGGVGEEWQPRTLAAAVKANPGTNLALISVAGDYAAVEASKALHEGLNVMIFSDNVSVEDEVKLKMKARDLGLLVMGPDCGTAVIDGVPLAFANKVNRGDIGIVGATNLATSEYAQGAVISANVGATLPIVGAVVGGPPGAAAMLILSQIFKKPLQEMGQVFYGISGPWEDPEIEPVDSEDFVRYGELAGCLPDGGQE